ncbi:MAG: bis(5'-nucleosyl)-tetraphosphatase (symmetrical) YqeK [Treponema sp.]|nr:bis(5'-nucleosyl)-tetraphosphatase (symmetrical) YqeK [Treponema sp.]
MDINNPELIQKIRDYAFAAEKKSRFEHSVRVAQTAEHMCCIYGVDKVKGYVAGLAHDMCKDLPDEVQLSLAKEDGFPISDAELKSPSLLHGRAAAVKLRNDFGVLDPEVLEAVARHTLGGSSLCPLSKIVYAADKIEPGRPQSSETYRKKLFEMSLDKMTLAVLEENIEYLLSKGKEPAPESYLFKESLLGICFGEN